MTFNLIIEYQTQKSDVFDINSRNNYTKFFHFLREKVHPKNINSKELLISRCSKLFNTNRLNSYH